MGWEPEPGKMAAGELGEDMPGTGRLPEGVAALWWDVGLRMRRCRGAQTGKARKRRATGMLGGVVTSDENRGVNH